VADAVRRLYTERNALKWDSDRSTMRMGDVIELTHPEPSAPWQGALFRYLIDDRNDKPFPGQRPGIESLEEIGLRTIAARRKLDAVPVEARRSMLERSFVLQQGAQEFLGDIDITPFDGVAMDPFGDAAITWEWLAGWLQGPMDRVAWEFVIPEMGYMALLRNLRHFEEAGIGDEARRLVEQKLVDPLEVARSRQLPIRFYSAYKALETRAWDSVLERALKQTVENIPWLEGRSLVMVDVSGSMNSAFSAKTKAMRYELAALFGCALGLRNEGSVYAYANTTVKIAVRQGESILKGVDAVRQAMQVAGGGTETWKCARMAWEDSRVPYDRIVIVTDEQAWPGGDHTVIPADVPIYTFNVAGYSKGHSPSFGEAKRYTFGGLSDAGFAAIAALESGMQRALAVS
jgi:hypothetical protein